MYDRTRTAIKKAFEVGRILFFMGEEKFTELSSAVSHIRMPTKKELDEKIEGGMSLEDAIIFMLREEYKSAAVSAGFTAEQGVAMLEYSALLEEIRSLNDEQ